MNLIGDRRKQTGARCHVRRMAGLGSLMASRHWNPDWGKLPNRQTQQATPTPCRR